MHTMNLGHSLVAEMCKWMCVVGVVEHLKIKEIFDLNHLS